MSLATRFRFHPPRFEGVRSFHVWGALQLDSLMLVLFAPSVGPIQLSHEARRAPSKGAER